jgi:hypothetical protein
MSEDKYKVPKPSAGDVAHAVAKEELGILPVAGGLGEELFQLVLKPPLEKRRDEWMNSVAEGLRTLEESGVKIEDLSENEEFWKSLFERIKMKNLTRFETPF